MKNITILSGKGGTGKSSISASLAVAMSASQKIICADCDVDASNLGLVFGIQTADYEEWADSSTAQKVVFDYDKCSSCKKCVASCYFKAIEFKDDKPVLKEFSCEGCGVCELVCPEGAIKLVDVPNAKIGYAKTKYGFKVVSAQLSVGESGSGKVVAAVKNKAREIADGAEIMLVDSAAGIACPVIASVTGSDYCVLVVEPTPSGLFDMERAYGIVKHFGTPAGIIINRYDLDAEHCEKIEAFAERNKLSILGKLPFDKDFVKALVNLTPVIDISKTQKKLFYDILLRLQRELDGNFFW